MNKLLIITLLTCSASAQNKVATVANFGTRAADTAQTCYLLKNSVGWRERQLPTQSCAGVAAINTSFAVGSFILDKQLRRHNHPKIARWVQWISIAGAAQGIVRTSHGRK